MLELLAAAGGEEPPPVVPLLPEVIVGTIAFAILCFVLMKFVFPRFEETYQKRVDAIEGGLKRAEERQAEADELLAQYKAQLAEARTEAARIRDDARAEGSRIVEDMRVEAQEQAGRIVARGEEQLATERERLVREIRGEIGTLAVDLAGRIVGDSLADEARRSGTVDRFLSDLDGAGTSGGSGAR